MRRYRGRGNRRNHRHRVKLACRAKQIDSPSFNMDRLPLEIIVMIVSFLDKGRHRAHIASLSRTWQVAVEAHTFRDIRLLSQDLDDFARIVMPARQASYLRHLDFMVYLDPCSRYSLEPKFVNTAVTKAFEKLFKILSRPLLPVNPTTNDGAVVDVASGAGLTLEIGSVVGGYYSFLSMNRYLRPPVQILDDARSLPLVPCVSTLVVRGSMEKMDENNAEVLLSWCAAVHLASRLPTMKNMKIRGYWKKWATNPSGNKDERHDLAKALTDARFFPHLQGTNLDCSLEAYTLFLGPSVAYTNKLGYEPLGAAFRKCSSHLSSLHLAGVFDESLFCPSEAERRQDEAIIMAPTANHSWTWSKLSKLIVNLEPVTPNGRRYFIGPPSTPLLDMKPCDDTMQPLFASWAACIAELPSLERSALIFSKMYFKRLANKPGIDSADWFIEYQAPHTKTCQQLCLTAAQKPNRRLVLNSVQGWRPRESTMRKLNEVGENLYPGTRMVELEFAPGDRILWASWAEQKM